MMLGKNDIESSHLGAAAEGRFLINIGRPQRFGTQYRAEGEGPLRLYEVGEGASDEARRLMAVPFLRKGGGGEFFKGPPGVRHLLAPGDRAPHWNRPLPYERL